MYIKKLIEDADDFVRYIRNEKGMADQMIQWSDEDLEEMFYYFEELSECDMNEIDDDEIWDILRFEFCVYRGVEHDSKTLDLSDFISDFAQEIAEIEDFDRERFMTDLDYRFDMLNFKIENMYSFFIITKSGDIISRYD